MIFLIFMIGIFPFWFHNNYLDIVWAKKSFFQVVASIFIIVDMICWIASNVKKWKEREGSEGSKSQRKSWNITNGCAFLFILAIVISCLLSDGGGEAFFGNEGRQLGGLFLLLCIGAYFFVARFYCESQIVYWTFLLANIGMWILVILNFWGIDLFGMYLNLAEYQYTYFIGTMGNININAGYTGVVTAIMMGFYYLAKERLTKICFWTASFVGMYAGYATRSDSWLLSVGGVYILLLLLAIKDREKLQIWWKLSFCFFFSSVAMKATVEWNQIFGWNQVRIENLREQNVLYGLLDGKVLVVQAVLLLLLFFMIRTPIVQIFEKWGGKILAVLLCFGVIAISVRIFPLDDSFGSNRGYIWKRTMQNFVQCPIVKKLFGCGPNCFLLSFDEATIAEMNERFLAPFLDAHNELLQFLTTTGICGVIGYFGMQLSLLLMCIKGRKEKKELLLGCIGIFAYVVQGLVNNPQVFTTPLFFIFLGVVESGVRKKV